MNTEVEDLLREGMERFTRDLRAPAGLIHRAARQRRRRLVLRSAAGAAAMTAGAVALVAVVAPGSRHDGTQEPLADSAYVVNRVDRALTAADPGEIAEITVTTSDAVTPGGRSVTTTAEEWSYDDQWRLVTNSTSGHPVYDEGATTSSVYTLVSYLTRTWAREPGLGLPAAKALGAAITKALGLRLALAFAARAALTLGPRAELAPALRGCKPVVAAVSSLFQPGLPGFGFSPSSLPGIGFSAGSLPTASALRSAISCGVLTVAGQQAVDGAQAIELTSRPDSPISETIWVRPDTYLPVRVVVRSGLGRSVRQQTANITWLPPTAQNLARLTVPIPAGFRRVSLPRAVLPILQQTPGAPLRKVKELCLTGPGVQGKNQCVRS